MAIRVSERYARALVEWVLEEKKEKEVRQELENISQLLKNSPDLQKLLLRKVFSGAEKEAALKEILVQMKASLLSRNFLLYLAKEGRFYLFSDVFKEFCHRLDELAQVKEAQVMSATELSRAFQKKIEEKFERWVGKKLRVSYEINPALLGGVITKIGNVVFDGSVQSQLKNLESQLAK